MKRRIQSILLLLLIACIAFPSLTSSAAVIAPAQSLRAGMNKIVFEDDFNSLSTFDLDATGNPGFKWYLDRPFGWTAALKSDVSISNSVLTIGSKSPFVGWGISTYSPKGDTGFHYQYGYTEAKIRFSVDANVAKVTNLSSEYFPCFWSLSKQHTLMKQNDIWGEIDYFEAYTTADTPYKGQYVGTVHEHTGGGTHVQNGNHWKNDVIKDSNWHIYGCLWTKGKITWYFDNQEMLSVTYDADEYPTPIGKGAKIGTYSILDNETMVMVLGAGSNWPMDVDYVRVWQTGNMSGVVVPPESSAGSSSKTPSVVSQSSQSTSLSFSSQAVPSTEASSASSAEVSEDTASGEAASGKNDVDSEAVSSADENSRKAGATETKPKNNLGLILGIIGAIVVAAGAGFLCWYFFVQKRNNKTG